MAGVPEEERKEIDANKNQKTCKSGTRQEDEELVVWQMAAIRGERGIIGIKTIFHLSSEIGYAGAKYRMLQEQPAGYFPCRQPHGD